MPNKQVEPHRNSSLDAGTSSGSGFEEHIKETLGIDLPEAWIALGRHAPWAMEAYFKMREPIFNRESAEEAEQGIPPQYLELIVVALDIVQGNEWGTRVHARAALDAGTPPSDLVHTVVMTIMSCGMVSFRKTGYVVLEEIEKFMHSGDGDGTATE